MYVSAAALSHCNSINRPPPVNKRLRNPLVPSSPFATIGKMPATRRSKKTKTQQPRETSPHVQTSTSRGPRPVYFWKPHETPYGVFSQWYDEAFTAPIDGVEMTFSTAEQYASFLPFPFPFPEAKRGDGGGRVAVGT